jgi:hypothetical protein
MKHLTLDDCNQLLAPGEEMARLPLVEHLLDCPSCRARYQALRDLQRHFHPRHRMQLPRFGWAAAALLLLGGGAWLLRQQRTPHWRPVSLEVLSAGEHMPDFELLQQVQRVSRGGQLSNWGSGANVLDLLETDPG